MSELAKFKRLLRFGLLWYSLLTLAYTLVYTVLHFKFYQINWLRYNNDADYHRWVDDKVLPMGVMRIVGNQRQMQDFWLMLPFLLGIFLSAAIFIFFWRNYVGRTFMPLVALLGFAIPFIPPYDGNLLIRLIFGLVVILFGAAATVWSTTAFSRVRPNS